MEKGVDIISTSWRLYYDMIFAVPIIYFFPQIAAVKNF